MELVIAAIGAELRELNVTMKEMAGQLASISDALKENAPSGATNTEQGNVTR